MSLSISLYISLASSLIYLCEHAHVPIYEDADDRRHCEQCSEIGALRAQLVVAGAPTLQLHRSEYDSRPLCTESLEMALLCMCTPTCAQDRR